MGTFIVVIFIVAASSYLILVCLPASASATTIYVGGGGTNNYTSIQAAIEAANPGDTVYIFRGAYSGGLLIDKSMSLIGEDMATTTIERSTAGPIIEIRAEGVKVANITVVGQVHQYQANAGIVLAFSNHSTITNTQFLGFGSIAINVSHSHDCSILDSTFKGFFDVDVQFDSSKFVTLKGNEFAYAGIVIHGNSVEHWNTHIIDTSNRISGKPVYYWRNALNGDLPSDAGQVILANTSGVRLGGASFQVYYPIQLGFSSGNVVESNAFGGYFLHGVQLHFSHCNAIRNNTGDRGYFSIYSQFSNNNSIALNSLMDSSIWMHHSNGNAIADNDLGHEYLYGVHLEESDGNTITRNRVYDGNGIYLDKSSGNVISDNWMVSDRYGGIRIIDSVGNVLRGNSLQNSGIAIRGDKLEYWNTHTIDTSNRVGNAPILYWRNAKSGSVPDGVAQVILANVTGVLVNNKTIGQVNAGIQLGFSHRNVISNNEIHRNDEGVYLSHSENNTLVNNRFLRNSDGVMLRASASNDITSNLVYLNGGGIAMDYSWNNSVHENVISLNDRGIMLYWTTDTAISDNMIYSNGRGVWLRPFSEAFFIRNVIKSNDVGIDLDLGIAHGYHNSFISNDRQIDYMALDNGHWDNGYPSGGNFWSDFECIDESHGPRQNQTGSDGICDSRYEIETWGDDDRYPLKEPKVDSPAPPPAPANVWAYALKDHVLIRWVQSSDPAEFPIVLYRIYRRNSTGAEELLSEVGDGLSFDDTTGLPGELYTYYVTAVSLVGESSKSASPEVAMRNRYQPSILQRAEFWALAIVPLVALAATDIAIKHIRRRVKDRGRSPGTKV